MPLPNWEQRYLDEQLPWDTGVPDPHLVELVEAGTAKLGRALEIGCGTGTNAIWLAQRGFVVEAFDLSSTAITKAKAKAEAVGVEVGFSVRDLLAEGAPAGPFELVFDRGVFHVFDEHEQRERFTACVAEVLGPAGVWLSMIGSTEGPPRDHGPPRRSARDIVSAVEPALELVSLRGTMFHANIPSPAAAWLMQARLRATAAQPSSVH